MTEKEIAPSGQSFQNPDYIFLLTRTCFFDILQPVKSHEDTDFMNRRFSFGYSIMGMRESLRLVGILRTLI
jgi:hypothetical protein